MTRLVAWVYVLGALLLLYGVFSLAEVVLRVCEKLGSCA